MSDFKATSPYLPTRMTDAAIMKLLSIARVMIYVAAEQSRQATFWEFLWAFTLEEKRRREEMAIGNYLEPEAVKLPEWNPGQLADALIESAALTYLDLPEECAEFVDWVALQVVVHCAGTLRIVSENAPNLVSDNAPN